MVRAHRSGFVQAIDDERLLKAAAAAGVTVLLEPRVGDRVVEDGPLARVWRDDGDPGRTAGVTPDICASVRIGYERTLQQDIAFGFRQLVDIAVKALSPGVNDPTTALHAIGHLTALLVRVADHGLGPRVLTGAAGAGRVVVPALDLSGYLDLSCAQIRRYGAGEPAVTAELLTLLRDVARREVAGIHRQAIARQADTAVAAAERETPEPRDLELIHALADEVHGLVVERGQTWPPTPTTGGSL